MIVITFDVLATRSKDIGASQPTKEGKRLWNLFFGPYNGRICVLADGIEKHKQPLVLEWLKRENIKAGSVDFHWEQGPDVRLDRVRAIHAAYTKIDWYVDTNPEAVAKVIRDGIPTLLVSVPYTVRPEWDEPRTIRGWDILSTELDTQALRKSEREWKE